MLLRWRKRRRSKGELALLGFMGVLGDWFDDGWGAET